MTSTLKDSKNNGLCDVELNDHADNTLIGVAKVSGVDAGSVMFYRWNNPEGLVVANNLEIKVAYRGKGLANYLIQQCSKKIIDKGGFGIFSTNYELDGIERLHELYWYKLSSTKATQYFDIKKLDLNHIDLTNYPKNDWLNVKKENVATFLQKLVSSGLTILNHESAVVGVNNVIDEEGHKVCHIKWFWGDISHLYQSIMNVMKVTYIAIPSLKIPCVIWDKSITYVYAKPRDVRTPFFSEQDICGWFLDR